MPVSRLPARWQKVWNDTFLSRTFLLEAAQYNSFVPVDLLWLNGSEGKKTIKQKNKFPTLGVRAGSSHRDVTTFPKFEKPA